MFSILSNFQKTVTDNLYHIASGVFSLFHCGTKNTFGGGGGHI